MQCRKHNCSSSSISTVLLFELFVTVIIISSTFSRMTSFCILHCFIFRACFNVVNTIPLTIINPNLNLIVLLCECILIRNFPSYF